MDRENKQAGTSSKIVFTILSMLCVGLIIVSYLFPDVLSPVRRTIGNFFSPMQKGITVIGSNVSEKLKIFSDKEELIQKNEELTKELEELRTEIQKLGQEMADLEFYRTLYDYDSVYKNSEKVAARVIGRNPSGACDVLWLDKGTDDGILTDMNVMALGGLVGIVTETGKNWCKVRTIIADDSAVSGRFQRTSDNCMVRGNLKRMDDGYIDVDMISLNAQVYDNYEVVTSYIGEKFLPGLLIGYVSNISTDPSELNKRAYLSPVVDFEHLEAVLIIKVVRENMEGLENDS